MVANAVTVHEDVDALAFEWERLAERVDGSPFMRPGWISAWLRAFGEGRPQLFAVRRDDELAALLPMQLRRGRLRSASNWHSPVFEPLALDDEAREALLDGLFRASRHCVELSLLDGHAGCVERAAQASGRRVLGRPIAHCPVVDTAGCFDSYERGLSRNRRKSLRRGRRALEQLGEVSFDVHEGLAGLDERLEEALWVEASGWKGERGTAIACTPETLAFYTEVARWAAVRGWLRLAFLRVDGRPIACDYSIAFQGAWYSLKAGYDESYRAYGPGALLLREELRHCFEHGLSRLELLGTADPFKLSWADRSSDRSRVHAFNRTVPGLAAYSRAAGREQVRFAVKQIAGRLRGDLARGHNAFASLAALWDRLGLEAQAVTL